MDIIILTDDGKRAKLKVNDQNMAGLLGRLKGPDKWLDVDGNGKIFINADRIIRIEEFTTPVAEPEE